MKYLDMHCDTLMSFAQTSSFSLEKNPCQVDFEKLRAGECTAQFFAMYMPGPGDWEYYRITPMPDREYIRILSEGFYSSLHSCSDRVAFAGNAADWKKNDDAGKISAFLTIEDGRPVEGDFANLTAFYELGVRLISLTWNHENCFGYPNSDDPEIMNRGLKPFGIEAVRAMNDLGMLVDVSHLSDGGFYDVAKYSAKPFVASHSDCRAVTGHRRNLTDDMIRVLGNCGGYAGINLHPRFSSTAGASGCSRVEDLVAHIRHFVRVGGSDCVGIGTDFDGFEGSSEIQDASCMPLLFDALHKAGFSDDQIEKVAWKNAFRVIRDAMK